MVIEQFTTSPNLGVFLVSSISHESIFQSETMKIISIMIISFGSKCLEGLFRRKNFNMCFVAYFKNYLF